MQNSSHASTAENAAALRKVKLLHTVAWAFFSGCILLVPLAAWQRRFDVALVLIMIVTVEVALLVWNRFKCPLTDVAARYTDDRRDNFDIYLPLWLARYNKHIFGSLFAAGVLFTLIQWKLDQP